MQSQLFKMLTLPLVFSFSLSVYLLFETEYISRMCPFESSPQSPILFPFVKMHRLFTRITPTTTNHPLTVFYLKPVFISHITHFCCFPNHNIVKYSMEQFTMCFVNILA